MTWTWLTFSEPNGITQIPKGNCDFFELLNIYPDVGRIKSGPALKWLLLTKTDSAGGKPNSLFLNDWVSWVFISDVDAKIGRGNLF